MISLRSSLDKLSAGARVIFGVAALLENTPFELYTLIRSGSARNASATMSRRTIWRSAEICRDHRVCRTRRWRREGASCRAQGRQEVISNGASFTRVSNPVPLSSESENFRSSRLQILMRWGSAGEPAPAATRTTTTQSSPTPGSCS